MQKYCANARDGRTYYVVLNLLDTNEVVREIYVIFCGNVDDT